MAEQKYQIHNKAMKSKKSKEILKPSVIKDLKEALEDLKHGRNVSKAFDNAEEAIRYLKGL